MTQPDDARRYVDRADELRAKADGFTPENRAMLLNMASYYEAFARQAEIDHRSAIGIKRSPSWKTNSTGMEDSEPR
jgi:hypothetical protein